MDQGSQAWQVVQPLGAARRRTCSHTGLACPVKADGYKCRHCGSAGTKWVNLLVCLVCGEIGCCDSSPGRHAYQHFATTGHPVARTLKAGENWGWCYVDEVFLKEAQPAPPPEMS